MGLRPFPRADQNHKHADKLLLLNWSAWLTPEAFLNRLDGSEMGIYIIRHIDQSNFLYIGEGKIKDRIVSHLGKGKAKEHAQYYYFKDQKCIELTYAQDANLEKHQRLEIENDLIAVTGFIDKDFDIPRDSIASIRSEGLFGKKSLLINPGFDIPFDSSNKNITFTETTDSYSIDMFLRYLRNINE